ncbi:hypothetical protein ANN_26974 [Periplaneta americana]|uniref:PiggyBac transposable element-derived protein domain-containing protein n=1 Tax=Periplaneta americana TaxID=6978 RepID=A0ABQ8RX98_PERAM|nr:hypothetical protein ANN_26974 [Periplaneta americana]
MCRNSVPQEFFYMTVDCTSMNEDKLKEGIFTGPEIRRVMGKRKHVGYFLSAQIRGAEVTSSVFRVSLCKMAAKAYKQDDVAEKLPISCCRTRNLTVEEILTTLEEKDEEIQKAETIDLVILPPDNENDTDIDEIPEEYLEVNVNDPHFLGPGVLGRGAEVRIVTHEKEKISLELNSSSTAAPLENTAITTLEAPSASATKRKSSDGVAYSKNEKRVMEKHWDSITLKPETAEDTKFKIKYSSDNPPEILETIVGNSMQPLQVFQLFWKPEFISHICKESKKYAQYKYGDNSYTVDIDKMYKMLGILLLSGYAKVPNRKMYWETQSDVNNAAVSNCMSRDRFLSILKYMHFSDN